MDITANNVAAIRAPHQATQLNNTVVEYRVTGDRRLAATGEGSIHGTLGISPLPGGNMIQRLDQAVDPFIIYPAFNTDYTLCNRRQHLLWGQLAGNAR